MLDPRCHVAAGRCSVNPLAYTDPDSPFREGGYLDWDGEEVRFDVNDTTATLTWFGKMPTISMEDVLDYVNMEWPGIHEVYIGVAL